MVELVVDGSGVTSYTSVFPLNLGVVEHQIGVKKFFPIQFASVFFESLSIPGGAESVDDAHVALDFHRRRQTVVNIVDVPQIGEDHALVGTLEDLKVRECQY